MPGIEHFCNVGVVHERQRLALRFEPGDDRTGVETEFDHLDGDFAPNRPCLERPIHDSTAALSDFIQDPVSGELVVGFQDRSFALLGDSPFQAQTQQTTQTLTPRNISGDRPSTLRTGF